MAVLATAGYFFFFGRGPALTESDSILVADFVNTTGDAVFDGTLKQALEVKLEESPFLNIVPEQRVRETLRFMGRPTEERLTPTLAREVCQRQGVKALLEGSIAGLGTNYVITLNAVNCRTGDSLARQQVEAASKEQVLGALGQAASRLRGDLGESLSSIEKFDTPVAEATTSSLEALKAFSVGEAQRDKGAELESIPFFQRAVELDPNFALAYARLGTIYGNTGRLELGLENYKNAFDRRDRVSERERYYITTWHYWRVTGELEKARQEYEVWKQTYPRDYTPRSNLAYLYMTLGEYEKALPEAQEALRLDPNSVFSNGTVAEAYMSLNRFEEAKAILEKALAQKIEGVRIRSGLYAVAFIQGDAAGMQRQVEWARGKPADETSTLFWQAWSAAARGQRQKAREFLRQAAEKAKQLNVKEWASWAAASEAAMEADFGNYSQARERAAAALALVRNRDSMAGAAATVAQAGDLRQAEALADELARQHPLDTLLHTVTLPTVRAALELYRANPTRAVELLQPAAAYELGGGITLSPQSSVIYIRGQAYLRARQGKEAAAEFQKILDHRGVNPISTLHPLAHLGMARAYALAGDTPRSRQAYQDFFALWKDADPDLPILREAKAEYDQLK